MMFVSSYNTYIRTDSSQKLNKQSSNKEETKHSTSSVVANKNIDFIDLNNSNIPINYISKSNIINNKMELESQNQKLEENFNPNENTTKELVDKFSTQNTLLNLKNSYADNSTMFSLIKKPQKALNQIPNLDKTLPYEPHEIKEFNMRQKMINTYISNDNYYKVTA
jgi:hypothetical protein